MIEVTGDTSVVWARRETGEVFRLLVADGASVTAGALVGVRFPHTSMHVFDAGSGARLG